MARKKQRTPEEDTSLLYAVVERNGDAAPRVASNGVGRVMVYRGLHTAMTAMKTHSPCTARTVVLRVIPFAAEGPLEELWNDGGYEHTEFGWGSP